MDAMKQDVLKLENGRSELLERSKAIGVALSEAQAKNAAELESMLAAEGNLQEATDMVDKLQKQKQAADRLQEAADARLEAAKARRAQSEQRAQQLRDTIVDLQEQIADSPEGLEQEIQELQRAIQEQKAVVEEKTDEKRARTQRVQALRHLTGNLGEYKEIIDRVARSTTLHEAACNRSRGARNELEALRLSLDTLRTEESDLKEAVQQMSAEMDAAKKEHDEQVQQFDERRQQATSQQQDLLGKRTEEQKQWSELQVQRLALETEIANMRRAHEADVEDFQARLTEIQDERAQYDNHIGGLMTQYDSETGRSIAAAGGRGKSPGSARSWSFNRSPGLRASPRRLVMDRAGY
jgi:chromosome segregation ATPase